MSYLVFNGNFEGGYATESFVHQYVNSYVDGSLSHFILSSSTGYGLIWNSGMLDVSIVTGSGSDASISQLYSFDLAINASISRIDASISRIDASLLRIDSSLARIDASIIRIDTSLNSIINSQALFIRSSSTGNGLVWRSGSLDVSLGQLAQSIIPAAGVSLNIGSSTNRINAIYADDLYLSQSSLWINDKKVISDESEVIVISTDPNQDLQIKTTGSGDSKIQSDNGILLNVTSAGTSKDVELRTDSNSGSIILTSAGTSGTILGSARGNIELSSSAQIKLAGNSIRLDSSTDVKTGNLTVDGCIYLNGTLVQNGSTYQTHAENVYTTKDFITMRDGAISGLADGSISGIRILKPNNINNLILGADNDAIMRVGWENDVLVALAGRENAPINGYYAYWDDASSIFKTADLKGYTDARWIDINRRGFTSQTDTTMSFNPATYVFTLAKTGSSWKYMRSGIEYIISHDVSVQLPGTPPTNGQWYIFIDSTSGALSASQSGWTLLDSKVPVALISWNFGLTPKYQLAEERHSLLIDSREHYYNHFTRGTQFISGGQLTGPTLGLAYASNTNASSTFGVSVTTIADEDIIEALPELVRPDGNSLAYTIFYRTTPTTWEWKDSSVPYLFGPNSRIFYDVNGSMTEAPATNNRWYNYYLLYSNYEGRARFGLFPGRGIFTSLSSAQAEDPRNFDFSGFPIAESVIAYQFTWEYNNNIPNLGKVRIAATPVKINVATINSVGSATGSDHNSLAGLQGGLSGEYYHLSSSQYSDYVSKTYVDGSLNAKANLGAFIPNSSIGVAGGVLAYRTFGTAANNNTGDFLGASSKAADTTLLDGMSSSRFLYGQNGSGTNAASATQNVYELPMYKSGFWEVTGASWTPSTHWYWGLTAAHASNTSSYNYSGQLAWNYTDAELYTRIISGGTPVAWRKIWTDGNFTPGNYAPKASPSFTGEISNTTVGGGIHLTRNFGSALLKALYFANETDTGVGDSLFVTNGGGGSVYLKANGTIGLALTPTGIISVNNNLAIAGSYSSISGIPATGNIESVAQGSGHIMKDETTGTRWQVHFHGDRLRAYNGSTEQVYVTSGDNISGDAGSVDGQHFSWSNNSNSPSYLWAADSNGSAYLCARGSMSVNYATSAGSATSATYFPPAYAGGVQSNPQVYFNNNVGLKAAMTGVPYTWCDTLWINGYSGGDVPNMCALHTSRQGEARMWISSQAHTSSSYGTTYEFITTRNIAGQSVSYANSAGSAPANGGTSSYVTVNYNNDSNSTYQMLWGSGNGVYGTAGVYINPYYDYLYATNFVLTSDASLKENIVPIPISPVNVEYKQFVMKKTPDKIRYGVIAQELQKTNPELVNEGSDGMLSVNYIDLLIKEIASLKARVAELENKNR